MIFRRVYELLSLNVGVHNIAPVILCVLKNMAHKSANHLPKHASICKMILEALIVVQAQLGEELSQTSGFNTLQTDGSTMLLMMLVVQDSHIP